MNYDPKYNITIKGHLNVLELSKEFTTHQKQLTTLTIVIKDQSELYGFITKLCNLGLTLLHLIETETGNGKNY